MKLFSVVLATSLLCGMAAADPTKPTAVVQSVTVKLADAKGKSIGTAVLTTKDKAVNIKLAVTGLKPGDHAIHIHETATCTAPDFKSAGGHFNPDKKHHGKDSADPAHPHAGDILNFTVDAKGNSSQELTAPNVTLEDGPHSVFTGGGTALVIHDKADDYKTDPTGNAGDRVACGVIKK